ncbi:MAG: hypothetical protein ACKO3N_02225 [Verrucomicrobiota bacterium]
MRKLLAVLAASAAMLTGCYIPEGTVRITGGTGESVEAFSSAIEDEETVIQATVNLNLKGETTKGFEDPTYGRINIQDLGAGITLQGTVVEFASADTGFPLPGVAALCVGRGKGPDGNWTPVTFVTVLGTNVPNDVSGPADDLRHVLLVFAGDDLGDAEYVAAGFFTGGNFVFHGEGGVIAR